MDNTFEAIFHVRLFNLLPRNVQFLTNVIHFAELNYFKDSFNSLSLRNKEISVNLQFFVYNFLSDVFSIKKSLE